MKRLLFAVLILAVLWGLARAFGLSDLSVDRIRHVVVEAGALGVAAYLGAFALGILAQVPGIPFLIAARLAWGPATGVVLAYLGALVAASVTFVVVRSVGGRALTELKWAPARKALARLVDRPIRTVAGLRLLFLLSPPLNYALALSSVRYRDYLAGSALGLAAPVAAWVLLSECAASLLGVAL